MSMGLDVPVLSSPGLLLNVELARMFRESGCEMSPYCDFHYCLLSSFPLAIRSFFVWSSESFHSLSAIAVGSGTNLFRVQILAKFHG